MKKSEYYKQYEMDRHKWFFKSIFKLYKEGNATEDDLVNLAVGWKLEAYKEYE